MSWKDHYEVDPSSQISADAASQPGEESKSQTEATPSSMWHSREYIRGVLALGAIVLLILLLIVYAITREIVLLSAGTVFVTLCGIVYQYYFPTHKGEL